MSPYAPRGPQPPFPMMALWTDSTPVRARTPVRIGDAERDEAIASLGEHYAAGRLTREEFDERSDQAMTARFRTDLEPLFGDLPTPEPVASRQGGTPAVRGPALPAVLFTAPALLLVAVVAAIVLNSPWIIWAYLWVFMCGGFFGHRRYRGPSHGR